MNIKSEQQKTEQWIEDKLPEIVRDLTRICRIRSVAEPEGAKVPPYGQGCKEVLEEMLQLGR